MGAHAYTIVWLLLGHCTPRLCIDSQGGIDLRRVPSIMPQDITWDKQHMR